MTKKLAGYSYVLQSRNFVPQMLLALALVGVTACGKKDASAGVSDTGQVAAGATASGDAAQAKSGMSDDDALRSYTLTMPKIDAFAAATKAATAAARTLSPDQAAALKEAPAEAGETPSLDQMAVQYDKFPPIRNAIKGAGLSSREYALIMFTTMQAMSMEAMTKANPKTTLPNNMNPANLEFAKANHDAIMRAMQSVNSKK